MAEIKRQTELDILRLLATLAVIVMHAGGNEYLSSSLNPRRHSMLVAAIVWCVPGDFFLTRKETLQLKRYGKNTYLEL